VARGQTFTSYINAEIPANTAQEFQRLENMATRTFGKIRLEAALVARSTAGLVGGGRSAAGGSVSAAAGGAAGASRVAAANTNVARSSAAVTAQMERQRIMTARLERQNSGLVRGLQATATTLNIVQGPLGPIAGRVNALSGAIERLTGFRLGLAAVGASIFALASAGNRAAEVRSKLAPLYETQEEVNREFSRTARIARDARVALEPVVDLYSRLTLTGRDMNLSQPMIEATTRAASLGARLSGGSSQAQAAGLTQLAQGIGSNKLGGEELKSILENTPRVAKALADGLSNTENFGQVTIGTLRQLGAEGELTAERVSRALGRSLKDLEEEARRVGPTWQSSTAAFNTELTMTVSKIDQALGLTRLLATGLTFVADNMRGIAALAIGVAAAFGTVKLGKMADDIGRARTEALGFKRLGDAIATATVAQARQQSQTANARLAQLRAEKAALQENVRILQQEQVEARNAVRGVQMSSVNGQSIRPSAAFIQRDMQATQRFAVSVADLRRKKEELRIATAAAAAASANFGEVQRIAGVKAGGFKNAVMALVNAFNPLGLAVAAVTTALIAYATAESQAEKNSRILEETTFRLANAIDYQTGKVLENNAAKIAGLKLDAQQGVNAAKGNYDAARKEVQTTAANYFRAAQERVRIGGGGTGFMRGEYTTTRGRLSAQQQEAQRLTQAYGRGQLPGGIGALVEGLNRLAQADPKLRGVAESITRIASRPDTGVVDAARKGLQLQANQAVLAGDTSEENLRRANGDFSGGIPIPRRGQRPRTEAELTAAADKMAAQLADKRHAAEVQRDEALARLKARKSKMTEDDYIREQAQIKATYNSEIQSIGATEARHAASEKRKGEAAARRIAAEEKREAAAAEKARDRRDRLEGVMDRFTEDTPVRRLEKLRDEAERAKTAIRDLIGESVAGKGTFTQADYEAKAREIDASVARETNRPITDARRDDDRQLMAQRLLLQGREDEARALERMFELQDAVGDAAKDEYGRLVQNEAVQRQINSLLAERERIVGNLMSAVEDARGMLEGFLANVTSRPVKAVKDLAKQAFESYTRIGIRQVVNDLLAGTDERVRSLINGTTKVDTAVGAVTSGMERAGSASLSLAQVLEQAAQRIGALPGTTGVTDSVVPASGIAGAAAAVGGLTPTAGFLGAMAGVMKDLRGEIEYEARRDEAPQPMNEKKGGGLPGDIVVTAQKTLQTAQRFITNPPKVKGQPTVKEIYNTIGESVGGKIDAALGTNFFKGIGKQFGTALEGAGKGVMASSVARAVGIKQSTTGAAIGGAAGNFIPGLPPGVGAAIGGLIGGTIGGLFKKVKSGSATIGGTGSNLSVTGTAGNSSGLQKAASAEADSVIGIVNRIAESLGGSVDASRGSVTIGKYGESYKVNTTGGSKLKKGTPGVLDFDEDEQGAIAAAAKDLIKDGVITGISQASQNILRAGKDLETALMKATVIESIPRRLMQLTDPVRYAVTELNREFVKMIEYLKEGGATTEQFADAQKLYDLERARAIETAMNQAKSAIQGFLDDMTAGPQSPLRKREVYANAKANIDKFTGDVAAGKPVDQQALLEAAKNFQDASRSLNGSSQSFFSDFNFLFDLLSKARDTAGAGVTGANGAPLPPSPFVSDPAVKGVIEAANGTTTAITDQTNVLGGLLGALIDRFDNLPAAAGGPASSIAYLPGVSTGRTGGSGGAGRSSGRIENSVAMV
jgi:tape measure domain-containing protein